MICVPWPCEGGTHEKIKLGPTGNFPRGKLNAEDEGGLAIAVGKNPDGVIIMDFGKEVGWIGLNQATAINIAPRSSRSREPKGSRSNFESGRGICALPRRCRAGKDTVYAGRKLYGRTKPHPSAVRSDLRGKPMSALLLAHQANTPKAH